MASLLCTIFILPLVFNFKLDDVFTNVFGKSASAITTQLLEHPGESFDVAPFVDGRCRTPIDKIQKLLTEFSYEQAEKLKIIRSHMNSLDRHKAELESLILGIAEKYTSQIKLLMTVPGINDVFTAIRIIAEIGVDMSVFETSKNFARGQVSLLKTMKAPARKRLLESANPELT